MKEYAFPWRVYVGVLRPEFPKKIVEIHDSHGRIVLTWGAFDQTGLTHARQKALAQFIVKSANAFEKEQPK